MQHEQDPEQTDPYGAGEQQQRPAPQPATAPQPAPQAQHQPVVQQAPAPTPQPHEPVRRELTMAEHDLLYEILAGDLRYRADEMEFNAVDTAVPIINDLIAADVDLEGVRQERDFIMAEREVMRPPDPLTPAEKREQREMQHIINYGLPAPKFDFKLPPVPKTITRSFTGKVPRLLTRTTMFRLPSFWMRTSLFKMPKAINRVPKGFNKSPSFKMPTFRMPKIKFTDPTVKRRRRRRA